MQIEIESLEELREHLRALGDLQGVVVQGLALGPLEDDLAEISGSGAALLGCDLSPAVAEHLRATGALIFPKLDGLPYHVYRPRLYSPDELMEGYERGRPASFWEATRDARIYHHYQEHLADRPILEAMAQRLHDHAIDDAKLDLLAGRVRDPHGGERSAEPKRPVAIMGGHAMRRDDPNFRAVARMAARLTRKGYTMVSGGGPGAMEATHLGAWLAHAAPTIEGTDEAIDEAMELLKSAPTYKDAGWFDTALDVKDRYPEGSASLAIPTWFYGHEPTSLFATEVAKYFSNSLREDGLLAIATHGVIYAPGSAGTIQEVFMDAAQNHYGTFRVVSPMVFFGQRYWTEDKPVEPLLRALAGERQYAAALAFVDHVEEVVDFIVRHPPVEYSG